MGRFKRNQRKTKTIVKTKPKKVEEIKKPNLIMMSKDKAPLMNHLVRNFLMSVKKRNKYNEFYSSYRPFKDLFVSDYEAPSILNPMSNNKYITISPNVFFRGYVKIIHGEEYYRNILGRLEILNLFLIRKNLMSEQKISEDELKEGFLQYELGKKGVPHIANDLVYKMHFGLIFTIIGYLGILTILSLFLNVLTAAIYSTFVLTCLLFLDIGIKENNNN